jgi:hypothetical protein
MGGGGFSTGKLLILSDLVIGHSQGKDTEGNYAEAL